MLPFTVGKDVWVVIMLTQGDPRLVDKTGAQRLATTDPSTRTVHVSNLVQPPLLDKVVLHEVAHAIAISYGLLDYLYAVLPEYTHIAVEEWAAQFMENHAIEAAELASTVLGRSVCIDGICH